VLECLPSNHEALSSNPSTVNKRENITLLFYYYCVLLYREEEKLRNFVIPKTDVLENFFVYGAENQI
jgi:hypothetical protein